MVLHVSKKTLVTYRFFTVCICMYILSSTPISETQVLGTNSYLYHLLPSFQKMQTFSSLKQEFLKNWIKGLQICSSLKKNMGIMEKKKAIKLSADLAMAAARKGRSRWSRAIIAKAAATAENNINDSSRIIAEHILGRERAERLQKASDVVSAPARYKYNNRLFRSKKILKKSHNVRRVLRKNVSRRVAANSLAKRLVQKRTQVLKGLVPGGELMDDEVSLIAETLDYLVYLQAQADVMRCLACATALLNGK